MKRLKIEENKKKKRSKHSISSGSASYVPSPYSADSSYLNGSLQSVISPTSNSFIASPLVPIPVNGANPVVYDSQIDDSNGPNMQSSPTAFYAGPNPNYFNGPADQSHFQQPEIVSQLVQSHYEQYKSTTDHDPANSDPWDLSPQFSSSLNSNTPGSVDQFFLSDSTHSPSTDSASTFTIHNSMVNSSFNLPFNVFNVIPNNLQTDVSANYSPKNQSDQPHVQETPPDIDKSITKIACLPDSQIIEEVFEQAALSKLRPSCSSCKVVSNESSFSSNEIDLINELLFSITNTGCVMNALTSSEPIAPENVIFELLRITDYSVRKSVKMAKKLSFFRTLCEEDQISALKGSSTEMMLCR